MQEIHKKIENYEKKQKMPSNKIGRNITGLKLKTGLFPKFRGLRVFW